MITNIINFFQRLYQDNPSVAAILGVSSAGIVTSIIYICRSKIQAFFYWIKKQFTTTFLITNDGGTSEVYGLILKWLKKYNKLYTRSLTAPQQLDVDELSRDKISDALQYGLGRHLIWFHRQPIWLHIYEEKLENSRERKLYLSMSIIGRSHNLIYELLDEVYKWNKNEEIETNKDKTRVNIYGYSGIDGWEIIRKRGFDTIYLSSKIEAEIKHNIQKFLDNEKIYVQHGIPYHYGMILYGPPGTGKTSIIKAIASEFDFDISLIDPLKFDITRLREKKENDKIKLLVIEDIDLLLGTKRETVEDIYIDEEEDIIGETIKVDRILYEEYELKKTMTVFDVGEYSLFFANGEDGQKRIFLLDNGYYLLDRVNATDKEIILQVKEYLGKDSSPYFNGVNDEKQKLGIIEDKEIKYDVKISKLYLDNRSIEAIKDDNGAEYVTVATDYNDSRDYLTILRDKDTFIQSMVDISKCGGTYREENNLYYCGEDEEYFYFKYQNKIEENDYIKFSKNQLLIDCKQFAGKIYSESDDKEYDLVQFEDYAPHSIEAFINATKEGVIQLAYTEVFNSRPIYYHLYYKYDDDEYIYFYQKRCIEKDGVLTSEYNTEEEKTFEYDVKIPRFYFNNKATFLKDEEGVEYSLIYTENDKLSVFIDDIRKKIIGIRKYTPRLEGHILDNVLFYCNEDEDYFYFNYSPKMSAEMNRDVTKPIGAKNQEELVEEQKLDYDYSIPINILEGNSWEKPFATNEGNNLYIWQSGMNNPIENIPSQGIKFVKHLIAENLYFYDTPKSVNFTKAYRYISHDENNIYIKEIANYKKPQIIKGDPFGEEFEIAKSTDSKDFAPIKSRPKTKVITSGKDSAGKKVLRDLMNAIDGLITKENFIIIATTNSIESLDPALIRPGRFDTAIKIDYIDIEVFNKAMMRYFGKTVEGTLKKKNLTISRLQVEFLMGKTFEDFKRKYVK